MNLLSRDQLAALGLTEQEVELVVHNRPIRSVLDLLFVDEFRTAAVRNLIAQGVLAGPQDSDLLEVEGPILAAPQFVAFAAADDEDGGKGGGTSFEVLSDNHYYQVEPDGKTTALVIPDCTSKEAVTIKGIGSADRIFQPGENQADVEREAKQLAEAALAAGIGAIATKSKCQDSLNQGCNALTLKIVKRDLVEVFSVPRKKRSTAVQQPGWKARYMARAELEVLCL